MALEKLTPEAYATYVGIGQSAAGRCQTSPVRDATVLLTSEEPRGQIGHPGENRLPKRLFQAAGSGPPRQAARLRPTDFQDAKFQLSDPGRSDAHANDWSDGSKWGERPSIAVLPLLLLEKSADDQGLCLGFADGESRLAARLLLDERKAKQGEGTLIHLRVINRPASGDAKCTCPIPRAGSNALCTCFFTYPWSTSKEPTNAVWQSSARI